MLQCCGHPVDQHRALRVCLQVSDALEKLFREHILRHLGRRLSPPDELRQSTLYTEEMEDALKAHDRATDTVPTFP